jgi:predicted DNA-binding protein (UPF0251 family)
MWRKKKERTISMDMSCICHCYGPCDPWIDISSLEKIIMEADELQALQYKDGLGLTMIEWAKKMKISKSVFGSIYKCAREKLVDMVISQKLLLVKCPKTSKK